MFGEIFRFDFADTTTFGLGAIIPDWSTEKLVFSIFGLAIAGFPKPNGVDGFGFGDGSSKKLLGDFESGAGVFDFVDDKDTLAVEFGWGVHDGFRIFGSDAFREIEGTDAGNVNGRNVFNMEIATSGGTIVIVIALVEVAARGDFGVSTGKPVKTIDIKVRVCGAFLGREIIPKSIDEPADGASGFVKVD